MIVIVSGFMKGLYIPFLITPCDQLESGCEIVNRLIASGFTPTRIQLKEAGLYLDLPLEIFDGESFEEPILQLQSHWRQLIENT
ncbi:hypothetical protein [Larkinella soli]|uniref:hypothetical protein n=1 Tax=Larkinella soli TaxID=1770527 RepID=UPI000FFB1AD2|nr:hypothetical protein [Larkinella soli]